MPYDPRFDGPRPSSARLPHLTSALRRVRRAVLVRRRPLAALLAALAVLIAVRAASEPPIRTTAVVVAGADLPGGTLVEPGDLTTLAYPEGSVPSGATRDASSLTGRVLAAPLRQGEPLTDVRLVAPGLLDGYPGLDVVPVRVADAASVGLLHVGDRIDLVAVDPDGRGAHVVAERVPVVALPRATAVSDAGAGVAGGVTGGGLVVVAVDPPVALDLADASVTSVLSVVLTR